MLVRFRPMATAFLAAAALTTLVGVNPAMASEATDPPTTPPKSDIVGVGSDTTQDVIGKTVGKLAKSGYAANYNATNPNNKVWSYDAFGSATIVPSQGCDPITRPNGSSAGITALLADEASGANCIDFARSSRVKGASDGDLVFVPFARDGVTWATFPTAPGGTTYNAPLSLTTLELNGIYSCVITNFNQVGGADAPITPYIPQSGSGTRSFFLAAIGVTTPGPCVQTATQENSGNAIPAADRPNVVTPYSISSWLAQSNKVSTDIRAGAVLRNIEGLKPVVQGKINPNFPPTYLRSVFNVLKPTDIGKASFRKFFGTTGYICKNPQIAVRFGFLPLSGAGCGF